MSWSVTTATVFILGFVVGIFIATVPVWCLISFASPDRKYPLKSVLDRRPFRAKVLLLLWLLVATIFAYYSSVRLEVVSRASSAFANISTFASAYERYYVPGFLVLVILYILIRGWQKRKCRKRSITR